MQTFQSAIYYGIVVDSKIKAQGNKNPVYIVAMQTTVDVTGLGA